MIPILNVGVVDWLGSGVCGSAGFEQPARSAETKIRHTAKRKNSFTFTCRLLLRVVLA